ncbi:hypothetical protein G5V59_06725 [Nocardioides sp. W3-2-3]|nr:hypothetical protein [Nocardioides convexus]
MVDCAPTAETLRLLALPEALGWYIERLLPIQRRLVRALRPVLNRAAGVPMPGDAVFDAITRLHAETRRGARPAVGAGGQRAAGAHPRAGRARRGAAGLHQPVPVRLPRRRGRREPDLPRLRRRPVACGLGGGPGRGAGRGGPVLHWAAGVHLGVPARGAGRRGGPGRPRPRPVRRRRPARAAARRRAVPGDPPRGRGSRGAPGAAVRDPRRGGPRPQR